MQVVALTRLAAADWLAGAWKEALHRYAEAISLARRIDFSRGLAIALGGRAMILSLQGVFEEAERCIAESRSSFGGGSPADRHALAQAEIAEAILALERGELRHAVVLAQRLIRPSAPDGSGGLTAAGLPCCYGLLAEAQALVGDGEGALQTSQRLISLGPMGAPFLTALGSWGEGLARRALNEPDAAVKAFTRAAEEFAGIEIPFLVARARLECAAVCESAKPELAIGEAKRSLALFECLGARRYAERARQLLKRLGAYTGGPRKRSTSGRLSPRELQIARLVAEGLTTGEVADRLILSPRTVTTHLDHIFSRLGINSRTALARYVIDAKLLAEEEKNT